MCQPDTKFLRTIMEGLDGADIISIMERLHAAVASGQLRMDEAKNTQSKQAIFQAAIGLLEADRAKLDAVLGAFKEIYSPNGSDSSGGAPKDPTPAPAASGEAITSVGAPSSEPKSFASAGSGQAFPPASQKLPQYYLCDTCDLWVKPTVSHTCTEDGLTEDCYNGFAEEELDIIHTRDGWEEIDPPETQNANANGLANSNQKTEVPVQKTEIARDEDDDSLADLLRPGSKLERVYKMVKELIETSGPQHLADMIEPARKRQLFVGVQNTKANLANFLSKLKARRLLVSDNRGFWSLPNKVSRR